MKDPIEQFKDLMNPNMNTGTASSADRYAADNELLSYLKKNGGERYFERYPEDRYPETRKRIELVLGERRSQVYNELYIFLVRERQSKENADHNYKQLLEHFLKMKKEEAAQYKSELEKYNEDPTAHEMPPCRPNLVPAPSAAEIKRAVMKLPADIRKMVLSKYAKS